MVSMMVVVMVGSRGSGGVKPCDGGKCWCHWLVVAAVD